MKLSRKELLAREREGGQNPRLSLIANHSAIFRGVKVCIPGHRSPVPGLTDDRAVAAPTSSMHCARSVGATAVVTAEQAGRLDADLTLFGAERAGNAGGCIPAWTGGLPKSAPIDSLAGYVDPYVRDLVLFAITGEQAGRGRGLHTARHLALLRLQPQTVRMIVYPTRRSAPVCG